MHEFQSSFLFSNLHIGFLVLLPTLCMLPFDLGENKDAILSINTYLFYIHTYPIQRKYQPKKRSFFFFFDQSTFSQKGLLSLLDFLYEIYFELVINLRLHRGKLKISYRQPKFGSVNFFLKQSDKSSQYLTKKTTLKLSAMINQTSMILYQN